MDMPRPKEEHRKLEVFAGEWTGEETMHPSPWDPKGGPAKAKIRARVDLDGFYVVQDYVQERDGKVSYRGHGVFGWDPGDGTYTMHWFDSVGFPTVEPARGTWTGDTLTFQQAGDMGHTRYTYSIESEDRYTFRLEQSRDGEEWASLVDGTFTRVG